MAITSDDFAVAGRAMWNSSHRDKYRVYDDETFRSLFGCSTDICFLLWPHVAGNETAGADVQPKHLLWALHFLKLYNPVRSNAAMIGCDAKTHTKWVWMVLTILANINDNVRNMRCFTKLHAAFFTYNDVHWFVVLFED